MAEQSKSITAREALAYLESKGIKADPRLLAAIENEKADQAFHKINDKLISTNVSTKTKQATLLQESLFALANTMVSQVTSETRSQQGRGNTQVLVTQLTVETDSAGTITVKVVRPAEAVKSAK